MARGVNKVILIGNLGRDPELKQLPSGSSVVNLPLATSDSWKDKNTGEQRERTEWHNIVFFNRLADVAGKYLKKGSRIYVEGALRTRKWQKDGVDRYTTEIVANDMQMLDSRGGNGDGGGSGNYGNDYAAAPSGNNNSAPASAPDNNGSFEDEDIPF